MKDADFHARSSFPDSRGVPSCESVQGDTGLQIGNLSFRRAWDFLPWTCPRSPGFSLQRENMEDALYGRPQEGATMKAENHSGEIRL